MKYLVLVLALYAPVFWSCTPPPINLTPAAVTAFNQERLEKTLDVIQNTAEDGSRTIPPVIAVSDAVKITRWHKSAVLIIETKDAGWPVQLTTSLDQLLKNLPPKTSTLLGPYVALTKTVLTEVIK